MTFKIFQELQFKVNCLSKYETSDHLQLIQKQFLSFLFRNTFVQKTRLCLELTIYVKRRTCSFGSQQLCCSCQERDRVETVLCLVLFNFNEPNKADLPNKTNLFQGNFPVNKLYCSSGDHSLHNHNTKRPWVYFTGQGGVGGN